MDAQHVDKLIRIGGSDAGIKQAQQRAATAMKKVGLHFPTNGCAANLCALLQLAGIDVEMTLSAGKIVNVLGGKYGSRKWVHIPPGGQAPGDVGVAYDNDPTMPGSDHVYLVIERMGDDEMLIADNQATTVHTRYVSGKNGKTPTEYFLRASHTGQPARTLLSRSYDPLEVMALAESSKLARYDWRQRGRAPMGYVKGMAIAFADSLARLRAGEPVEARMAATASADNVDALSWYQNAFEEAGLRFDDATSERLRQLYVLLVGLGMRESSGRYCEGRDRSASNVSASTAEAGLFQSSHNLTSADPMFSLITARYAGSIALAEVFREGVRCKEVDWENFGTGPGREFQMLSKACPAFAVDCAALGLRLRRKHWGPISTRAAEIRPECDQLLRAVAELVDNL